MSAVAAAVGGRIAALGEAALVEGYALSGVLVIAAEDPAHVRTAWQDLPPDVEVVFLTPAAAQALGPTVYERPRPLTAVMPP